MRRSGIRLPMLTRMINVPAFDSGAPAAAPTTGAPAPATGSARRVGAWLRAVLNVSPQSALALPLAAGMGAGAGSALALAFEGVGNLLPGTGVGALLGMGGWAALRWSEQRLAERRGHQARVQMLSAHSHLVRALREQGTCLHDVVAVKQLCDRLDRDVRFIDASFQKHCEAHGLAPAPLMREVLRTFFLHHCAERGMVVISRGSTQECYLVAAHRKDHACVRDAINRAGTLPPEALRRLGCPFMRVDLANASMRDAQAFEVDTRRLEWKPTPTAGRQMAFPVGLPEQVTRSGRRPRRMPAAQEHVVADVVAGGAAGSANPIHVERGKQLWKDLAPYGPQSRIWRDIRGIEQFLRTGREVGHPIRFDGELYLSADVHLDGTRGRNVMRLLIVKAGPERFELVRIVNYHDVRLQHGSRYIAPQPTRSWRP